ncbi:MAG: hypothetical protein ABR530_05375 [Pyrinomonadaceae bacterium]
MAETDHEAPDAGLQAEQRIQTEDIAFAPTELVACGSCERMNAPNRMNCIYCGFGLNIPESTSAVPLVLRPIETWERGANLILTDCAPEADLPAVAKLLSADPAHLLTLAGAGIPLPLARVESQAQAEFLHAQLESLGVRCHIVDDAELAAERPPTRLAGIEVGSETLSLKHFNTDTVTTVGLGDVALIIEGVITTSRVESEEKRGGRSRAVDEIETVSEQPLLDVYTHASREGFRIMSSGFDFSCLGEQKGFLGAENLKTLAQELIRISPAARLVPDYQRVRKLLGNVWEPERQTQSSGMQRAGLGKVALTRVSVVDNMKQFTKFSRLQRHLI